MGIKGLTKLLADNAPKSMKEQKFENYFGRKIAVDASMSIYQFLHTSCLYQIMVGRTGMETLTNEAGEVTSHLQGMFTRTIRMLEAGIKPVYVFDGQPPELKRQELAKRYSKREDATKDLNTAIESGDKEGIEKFSKRTVEVTKQHNEDCKRLLRLMGVPVIEAPCEAEAQCVELCKSDKVYAVASEDMDSLTFGAPRFLRHLMDPSSKKIPVMEFEVAKVLEELELTMDQFIDLCILLGCDYCDSIKGIGGLTALKLIRQHGSIESILENINKERYQIPEDWPYQEARRLFKEPNVSMGIPELKWTAPDEEGLVNFLVNENGFNSERVTKAIEKIKAAKKKSTQGRLESFFKPVTSTTAPPKRKPPFVAAAEQSSPTNRRLHRARSLPFVDQCRRAVILSTRHMGDSSSYSSVTTPPTGHVAGVSPHSSVRSHNDDQHIIPVATLLTGHSGGCSIIESRRSHADDQHTMPDATPSSTHCGGRSIGEST